MKPFSQVSFAVRTAVCVALALAAPLVFGADAGGVQAQAQLLDHAVFPCVNCFFGTSDHYYCFAADNKVLIGHRRAPVMNWRDSSKNALPKIHGGWADWKASGQSVALRYDDQYIWLPRPEDKEAKTGVWASMKAATAWIFRAKSKQVRLTRDCAARHLHRERAVPGNRQGQSPRVLIEF